MNSSPATFCSMESTQELSSINQPQSNLSCTRSQSGVFQINTWLKLYCHSFPSLKGPLNDRHVYRGEIFLFSEYITENRIQPHVPGELRTIKHTKQQNLNCKSYCNKGLGILQWRRMQLCIVPPLFSVVHIVYSSNKEQRVYLFFCFFK